MCTAICYQSGDFYFGRNFDLEYSYREEVTITPRNFVLPLRRMNALKRHHALIGMAYVQENFPLYYDAANERGLCMAGLNFPGYAFYEPERTGKDNLSPFELIPYILGTCSSAEEAEKELGRIHLAAIPFSKELPLTPLHWIVADREKCLVAEPTEEGFKIYQNPAKVLTNSPPFPVQTAFLANYMQLSPDPPVNRFGVELSPYSRGMGAMGLPGDMSSSSRFVKAAFVLNNSHAEKDESSSVNQFFHILTSAEQVRGSVRFDGHEEITIYSACCNADRGIYYYTTYENRAICGVDLHLEDLEGKELTRYPLQKGEIFLQNRRV